MLWAEFNNKQLPRECSDSWNPYLHKHLANLLSALVNTGNQTSLLKCTSRLQKTNLDQWQQLWEKLEQETKAEPTADLMLGSCGLILQGTVKALPPQKYFQFLMWPALIQIREEYLHENLKAEVFGIRLSFPVSNSLATGKQLRSWDSNHKWLSIVQGRHNLSHFLALHFADFLDVLVRHHTMRCDNVSAWI